MNDQPDDKPQCSCATKSTNTAIAHSKSCALWPHNQEATPSNKNVQNAADIRAEIDSEHKQGEEWEDLSFARQALAKAEESK